MASKVFGIDFGTSTIKIYRKGQGIVFNERNIIAISNKKNVIAVGDDAFEMYEKAPSNIKVSYPVRNGVIADVADMTALLTCFIKQYNGGKRPGAADYIVATPTDITEVERRSFYDLIASSDLKVGHIKIVEKPIADAVGAGLNVTNAHGVMVVDIGADTTEISVLSLGGIVLSKLIPVGGNRFDDAIKSMVKRKYNLYIGDKTAENIKKKLASAIPEVEGSVKIFGRDVVSGLPIEMEIKSSDVYEAISEYLFAIIDSTKIILERTPPEITADFIESGIYITGGSAKIFALDKLLHQETDLKINICPDSSNTVVNGLGKIMEEPKLANLADALRPKTLI